MAVIPYASLLAAFLLIYVPLLFARRARAKLPGGVDNAHPRVQQAQLTGLGARALGAHANGFESFAPFAAAVLACQLRHVAEARLAYGCLAYLGCRVLYTTLYLGNVPKARSTVWFFGMVAVATLFVFAILA